MLTKIELGVVEIYLKAVSRWGFFPLDWKNGRLSPTNSKSKIALVAANLIFACAYFAYILLRLSKKFGGFTLTSMPFHAFAIIFHLHFVFFSYSMFKYPEETCALFNQLKQFNMAQGNTYAHQSYHQSKLRDNLVRIMHRWINATGAILGVLFLAQPNDTYYLYSMVPASHQNFATFIAFFFLEAFLAYKIMVYHLFAIFFGFFYIVSTNFWVNKVCSEWSISAKGEPTERVETDLGIYRCLTLLNILYNESFASIIVPLFKTLIEVCFVICAYGTIRFYGLIPIQVYQLLPGLASFLFIEHQFAVDRMATIHDNSSRMRSNYVRNYLTTVEPEKDTRLLLLDMMLNMLVALLLSDHPSI